MLARAKLLQEVVVQNVAVPDEQDMFRPDRVDETSPPGRV